MAKTGLTHPVIAQARHVLRQVYLPRIGKLPPTALIRTGLVAAQ